ncbi:MAG: hypothetical protein JO027_18030 [Solirubrobacterales bacterium]|nr:hypothetical protein [Solirubrobacterales bacterium]
MTTGARVGRPDLCVGVFLPDAALPPAGWWTVVEEVAVAGLGSAPAVLEPGGSVLPPDPPRVVPVRSLPVDVWPPAAGEYAGELARVAPVDAVVLPEPPQAPRPIAAAATTRLLVASKRERRQPRRLSK